MFADATDWVISAGHSANYVLYGEQYGPPPIDGMIAYRHSRGANIIFFDGHGAWLPRDSIIYDPATKKNLPLWNVLN